MVKRNQQQWYNINPLFVVVQSMHGKEESTAGYITAVDSSLPCMGWTTTNSGLMLYHCCWFLFTIHGLDNNKQWINVISLLLIPLYHAWAGQQKTVNSSDITLIHCLLLSSPWKVKRNQQQWYNINPLFFVVQPMHGKEESTAVI
jgi:hypothetical protein